MNFEELQKRLVCALRQRVQNGEFTERGLARAVGISQVHIHNVLKGARTLSINLSDLILERLGLTILDVCTPAELQEYIADSEMQARPSFQLPFLVGRIGPDRPWSTQLDWRDRYPVPHSLSGPRSNLRLARLAEDCAMASSLSGKNIVVLEFSDWGLVPDALYVVDRGHDAVIRRIRFGSRKVYLVSDDNMGCPVSWEVLPRAGRGPLIGRVRWLGKERAGRARPAIGIYKGST